MQLRTALALWTVVIVLALVLFTIGVEELAGWASEQGQTTEQR